jgi:hypothetical protein
VINPSKFFKIAGDSMWFAEFGSASDDAREFGERT